MRPCGPDGAAHGLSLVAAKIVEDHNVTLGERGIGPSVTQGTSTRSQRKGTMKIRVFEWPCRTGAASRRPRGHGHRLAAVGRGIERTSARHDR